MKYPRTFHTTSSPGATSDDKIIKSMDHFISQRVIVTEKLDGENCTFTNKTLYARSASSKGGILRERCKALWAQKHFLIPDRYRLCGENMQWQHSIRYENLISPFYAFSLWYDDICLSWEDTVNFCNQIGIPTVPVLFEGVYEDIPDLKLTGKEGYVIRLAGVVTDFSTSVVKWVRKGHVQTNEHWSKNLIENGFVK